MWLLDAVGEEVQGRDAEDPNPFEDDPFIEDGDGSPMNGGRQDAVFVFPGGAA
jgi:hypothetical protein